MYQSPLPLVHAAKSRDATLMTERCEPKTKGKDIKKEESNFRLCLRPAESSPQPAYWHFFWSRFCEQPPVPDMTSLRSSQHSFHSNLQSFEMLARVSRVHMPQVQLSLS